MAAPTTTTSTTAEQPAFHPLPRRTLTLPNPATNTTITASYACSYPSNAPHPDPAKPTVVFFHSFSTDASLFAPQFGDARLADACNLIAIDLLGHGGTRIYSSGEGIGEEGRREALRRDAGWTYWDSAAMAVGVVRGLGVERCFVQGTSQGGWVAVRMALVAPEMVLGIIPMGTSIDHESPRSIDLGCWDGRAVAANGPLAFTAPSPDNAPTPSFAPPDQYCDYLIAVGFAPGRLSADAAAFWNGRIKANYAGDAGRRRLRTAAVCLAERDGLEGRVGEGVRCPVLWLQGDRDEVYSVRNAEEGMKAFGAGDGKNRLVVVEGGAHFLSADSFGVVNGLIAEFVGKWWKEGGEA